MEYAKREPYTETVYRASNAKDEREGSQQFPPLYVLAVKHLGQMPEFLEGVTPEGLADSFLEKNHVPHLALTNKTHPQPILGGGVWHG